MQKDNFLKDDWSLSGTDLHRFSWELEKLAAATTHRQVSPSDVAFVPIHRKEDGYFVCSVLKEVNVNTFYSKINDFVASDKSTHTYPTIPTTTCPFESVDEELATDSMNTNGMIMALFGKPIYISEAARGSLLARADLGGKRMNSHSLPVSLAIADGFYEKRGMVTLAIRKDSLGNNKIFSFLSDKYEPIPQSTILDVAKRIMSDAVMGETEVREWQMDHEFTRLYLEFPEKAEEFASMYGLTDVNIPGVVLMSSDTGASSFIVRGTYRSPKSSSYVMVDEVMRRHQGKTLDVNKLLEECDTTIFQNYRKLPEAMAEKIGKVVGAGDVSCSKSRTRNKEAVQSAIRGAMSELGLMKELSEGRGKKLSDALCAEVNGGQVYTEYDLAQTFLGLPGRLDGLCRANVERVSKLCGRAPFIDYQPRKHKTGDNEGIVLMPEGI